METMPASLDDDVDLLELEDGDEPRRPLAPWWTPEVQRATRIAIDAVVVAGAVLFVLAQLGPRNLLANNTPTGGDMGGHVWGPAFLRDQLLPSLRLTGWSPDWYAGFPAYQFYMVLPALLIVVLNTGLHGWAALVPLGAAAYLTGEAIAAPPRTWHRRLPALAAVLLVLFGVGLPYGVAFKVVTALGVLAIPAAVYVAARLAGLDFPTPALMAAFSLVFLFNREPIGANTGNIIGGNVTSTLAGEYSFSIALALAILFLGLVVDGLRTGRRRWQAPLCLALAVCSHLIVGIFAVVAALAALVVWPGVRRLKWMVPTLVVGGMVSAFWTVPFVLRSPYVNDMGWEKSPPSAIGKPWTAMFTDAGVRADALRDFLFPKGLHWVAALALVGLVVAVVQRVRAGLWLGLVTVVMGLGFMVFPEARLWNARILPFWYLGLALMAAIGVAELSRAIALLAARDTERPLSAITHAAPVLGFAAVLVVVGLPLQVLPGQQRAPGARLAWGPFATSETANPARGWAQWNYTGYEGKAAYAEYYDFIQTFARVGREQGCGRAMWEYEDARLQAYGTPMAPMLLPYWTNGCIGSMEGLYFESSTTTPYHFINQSELSFKCSCAQRNLPYPGFDVRAGVQHLQLLGVRYYAASTPQAVKAAAAEPALTEVAVSGPWHIYLVAGSDLVTPLANEPAVLTADTKGLAWTYGSSDPRGAKGPDGQLLRANGPATTWYLDPSQWDVELAASGPSSWARVAPGETPPAKALPAVTVSDVRTGTDTISFGVDQVGVPVLVKASYFPNWKADGATGPYRVTPNLMVVIPTSTRVRLYYGRTPVDLLGYGLTLVGIALLVVLARRPQRAAAPAER